ncbi:MAG: hypothetical protein ABIQ65_07755 [Thermoanaerobaculia bacterium]
MPYRPTRENSSSGGPALDLNVARVHAGASSFAGQRRAYDENNHTEAVSGWEIIRFDSWLYSWRVTEGAEPPVGWEPYIVTSTDTPRVFWRAVERGLVRHVASRGFTGPHGKGRLLVEASRDLLAGPRTGTLAELSLHPAFTFDIFPHPGLPPDKRFIVVGSRTAWRNRASIATLHAAGIDCTGFGVRLDGAGATPYAMMEGRLVGTVATVEGDDVALNEPRDAAVTRLPASLLFPEASHQNVRRILDKVSPGTWQTWADLEEQSSRPAVQLARAHGLVDLLAGAGPIEVVPGVSVGVSRETNTLRYFPASHEPSPQLVFDFAAKQSDVIPTRGLKKFGPYDGAGITCPRFLVIGPKACQGVAHTFFNLLAKGCPSSDPSKKYLAFDGFKKLFHLAGLEWDHAFFEGAANATNYRQALLEKLRTAKQPDLVLVVLHDAHKDLAEADDPYCVTKAVALGLGIPVSALTVEDMSIERQRTFILGNVALQAFAKMGGTPFVLAAEASDRTELIIGVGRSDVVTSRFSRRRFIGYASVFRANGDYLLATVRPFDKPTAYGVELEAAVTGSLREAIAREGIASGGKLRLTFHLAKKPGQRLDIAPVEAALLKFPDFDIETAFVHVSDGHGWLVVDRADRTGVPARGTVVEIGAKARLLSVVGPGQYLGRGTPSPLRIDLDRRSTYGEIDAVVRQVFGFTAVTWRGFNVSAKPVTIQYAELACELAGRLAGIEGWNPTALDVSLRDRRWFL